MLRIMGFNVYDENPKSAAEIVDFVFSHNADIVDLQEVREDVLRELLVRGIYHLEFARGTETDRGTSYLVILSKFKIERHGVIQNTHVRGPWWKRIKENIESHFVLVNVDGISLQIFNMHLPAYAGPLTRARQFRRIIKQRKPGHVLIVAGDFNIYADRWYHKLVGFIFLGHSFEELFSNTSERDSFEEMFKEHGLRNVFRHKATYSFISFMMKIKVPYSFISLLVQMFLFQLDHIIVPNEIAERILKTTVLEESGGSDHRPIIVELDM